MYAREYVEYRDGRVLGLEQRSAKLMWMLNETIVDG